MARWYVNPRRRRGGKQRRPRVRVSGHQFLLGKRSPFKGRIRFVNPIIRNPFIREVGMYGNPRRRRRRRNPHSIIRNPGRGLGLAATLRDPMGVITTGATGALAAYFTITLPNMLRLFPGTDLVSKVLRGLTRAVAAGLVYQGARAIAPRQANAALVGGFIGAGGSFILDLLGTRLIIGAGDVVQTPGMLFSTMSFPAIGAYTRPMGAYTRPMGVSRGYGGIYGPTSMGMMHQGANIY